MIKLIKLLYNKNEKNKKDENGISLIIGQNPHEYNNEKYHLNNYIKTEALKYSGSPSWTFDFINYYYYNGNKIKFNFTSFEEKLKGTFWFNLDIIIGMHDYLRSIKLNYFNKYEKECNISLINNRYTVIYCNKNFNVENFTTLYFYNINYNYTFELTYKDLFQIKGDKKYFLIIFDLRSNYPWKFGKLFIEKYFFNFDMDSKSIGFYRDLYNSETGSDNKSILDNKSTSNIPIWIILALLLIILTGIGCFLFGRLLYKKKPKKRANELDDDFEYVQKKDEETFINNSNNNKLGIN